MTYCPPWIKCVVDEPHVHPALDRRLCDWLTARAYVERMKQTDMMRRVMALAAREIRGMRGRRFRGNGAILVDAETDKTVNSARPTLPFSGIGSKYLISQNMVALAVKILCERGLSLESALSCLESRASLLA